MSKQIIGEYFGFYNVWGRFEKLWHKGKWQHSILLVGRNLYEFNPQAVRSIRLGPTVNKSKVMMIAATALNKQFEVKGQELAAWYVEHDALGETQPTWDELADHIVKRDHSLWEKLSKV